MTPNRVDNNIGKENWKDLFSFPRKPCFDKTAKNINVLTKANDFHYKYLYTVNSVVNNYVEEFTDDEYSTFTKFFNTWMIDELINTGKCIDLPYKLGKLMVLKSKSKKGVPDWKHYRETGKIRVLVNDHTDGYKCSIYHLVDSNISSIHGLTGHYPIRYSQSRYSARRTAKLIIDNPNLVKKYQEYADYKHLVSFNKIPIKGKINKIRKDYIVTKEWKNSRV